MAYIQTIQHEDASGRLKELYDELMLKRGKLAEVHKIQSLNPESLKNHMDLYMTLLFGKSPLKRYQRELIAVVVSIANGCEYCKHHHGNALNFYWKDENRLMLLYSNFEQADLDPEDTAMCRYAEKLTTSPALISSKDIDELKKLGFTDRAILDLALIANYFNFVNRMVLGLGVHLEEDGGIGYEYEIQESR